jgi:hypothetical protein
MKLTEKHIILAKSVNGGFSKEQLHSIGVKWIKKGWLKEIMKKDLSNDAINLFISLKDKHLIFNK